MYILSQFSMHAKPQPLGVECVQVFMFSFIHYLLDFHPNIRTFKVLRLQQSIKDMDSALVARIF